MLLSREIIKRILADVGAVPGSDFGKFGLTLPEFKLKEKIFIVDEHGTKNNYPVWVGQCLIGEHQVRALLVDLTEDVFEFSLAFRVDQKPVYVVKLVYDDYDDGDFFLQEGENWVTPNVMVKSLALVGMETLVDQGVSWCYTSNYDDLYQAVLHLIEL